MLLLLNLLENTNIIRYRIVLFNRVNFETLEQVYDERFAKHYGFFRPYVKQVIYRYPWPRPGLLCILQGTVSKARNPSVESKWSSRARAGLIAASCTTALPVSNVRIVIMSIYWHLSWSVAEIPLQRDKRRQFCPSCHPPALPDIELNWV